MKCIVVLMFVTLVTAADKAQPLKRYQLGTIIRNSDGSSIEQLDPVDYKKAGDMPGKIAASNIFVALGQNQEKYRFTTYSSGSTAVGFASEKGVGNHFEGCIATSFMSFDQLLSKDNKVENNSLVILKETPDLARFQEMSAKLGERKLSLGFMKRNKPISEPSRALLTSLGIRLFENLDIPDDLDINNNTQPLFGFKFVFSPFSNGTSISLADVNQKHGKMFTNLAQLVLYEGDKALGDYCNGIRKEKAMLPILSRTLLTEDYPIGADADRPVFVDVKNEHRLSFSGQTGTHIVSPFRFDQTKSNLTALNEQSFFAPCVCIKVAPQNLEVPNFKVSQRLIVDYEQTVPIPEGSIVLIDTGFGQQYWSNSTKYVADYPVLDNEAARYLVETRKVAMIGMDTLALDKGKDNKYTAHGYLAEKNIPVILNLQINDLLFSSPNGARCVVTYLRTVDGIAAPVGLFVLPNYDPVPAASTTGVGKTRWQFGAVIAPSADVTISPVSEPTVQPVGLPAHMRILASEMSLTVDPTLNPITTFTAPVGSTDPVMQGCIPTRFIKATDSTAIKQKLKNVTPGQIVLYLSNDLSALKDVYRDNKKPVTIGVFAVSSMVSADLRDSLVKNQVSFFENLVRPDGFRDDLINEDSIYYGFKFVMSPFQNETSLLRSLTEMKPPRKINLADFVVFNSSATTVYKRCDNAKSMEDVRILSQKFGAQAPVFDQVKRAVIDEKGRLGFSDHFGTHFDVPYHFDPYQYDTTRVPWTMDHPECVKVIAPYQQLKDNSIKIKHIEDYEQNAKNRIPNGAIVIFVTGYGNKWADAAKYYLNFPGLSLEAAKWLVEQRKVTAIGIDTLSLDEFKNAMRIHFPVHSYLTGQGVIPIVNVGGGTNSDHMPGFGGQCVFSYLRFEKATAAQAAIFGLPDMPTSYPAKPSSTSSKSKGVSITAPPMFILIMVALLVLLAKL